MYTLAHVPCRNLIAWNVGLFVYTEKQSHESLPGTGKHPFIFVKLYAVSEVMKCMFNFVLFYILCCEYLCAVHMLHNLSFVLILVNLGNYFLLSIGTVWNIFKAWVMTENNINPANCGVNLALPRLTGCIHMKTTDYLLNFRPVRWLCILLHYIGFQHFLMGVYLYSPLHVYIIHEYKESRESLIWRVFWELPSSNMIRLSS